MSQYYLKAVKRLKDIPKKMKADDGIEHSLIEPIHIYLRSLNDDTGDALHSFSIVSSPFNQRIESYCSKFVSDRPGWWKSFFYWKLNWSPHLLSPKRNNTPSSRPDVMYFLPHLYGITDHMISIKSEDTGKLLILPALYPLTSLMSLVSL